MLVTHSIGESVFLSDRVIVMSRRPGRVLEDIAVDLPRPRTFEVTTGLPEYHAIARRIRELLNASGDRDAQ